MDGWLAELFDDDHLDHTCEVLARAGEPDPEDEARRQELRSRIDALDAELDGYRTIVCDEPGAAANVGKWIAETTQEQQAREPPRSPTHDAARQG